MIHSVSANDPRFRTVSLNPGLNVLVAEKSAHSLTTDTRNGVGKTLLMEIIHYCLGGTLPKSGGLSRPELTGWEFTIDLDVGARRIKASRSISNGGQIVVRGEVSDMADLLEWDHEREAHIISATNWKNWLGKGMFGIVGTGKYGPTFRMLFPYFARVHTGAYQSPFDYYSRQRVWQRQVAVSYLLGLSWEDAISFQVLKEAGRRSQGYRTRN